MTTLVSAAGAGRVWRSASCIFGKAATGFHLLRVEAYSQTKTVPSGESIDSDNFRIGERRWTVKYYPNGRDTTSTNSDYISLYLQLLGFGDSQLQAEYKLSILDQAGNVAYGLPSKTDVFKCGGGGAHMCGHERFIRREDLERREDLLKDNCVAFRCDVRWFTLLNTASLAREDNDDQATDDDEYGLKPRSLVERHRCPQRRRPDDMEFVRWCLAQKRIAWRSQ